MPDVQAAQAQAQAFAAAAPATAGDPSADPAGRQFQLPVITGNRDDFSRALRAPLQGFLAAARTIHHRLLPWGLDLLALLTGLSLTWIGLKAMLDRGAAGMLMTEFLTLSLTAGILFSVLDNWSAVTDAVINGTGEVSTRVSGNVQDGAAAIQGVHRVLDAGFALWEHPQAGLAAILDPISMMATLLFKLLVVGLLLLCACIYLGIYLMSMTLLSIAFALGPVFVPWLLIRPASFLFDGWLRFTLAAALYQVIGIVIVTLVSRMHEPMMSEVGTAIGADSLVLNFYYFAAAFVLSGVSALMMLQVPAIANGLLNGSLSTRLQSGLSSAAAAARGVRGLTGGVSRGSGQGAARAAGSGQAAPSVAAADASLARTPPR